MDVVWLILDSVSFEATPFAPGEPDTIPEFAALAEDRGVVFQNAYAPGPLSPSSHAAMFTGELPSTVGMHEAHPYLERNVPTIGGALADTHRTALLSTNMWLFQGLDREFDIARDYSRPFLRFQNATDPHNFFRKHDNSDSRVRRFVRFLFAEWKPFRSLANYLSYRRSDGGQVPAELGDAERHQHANFLNDEIRSLLVDDGDQFVVANYMDAHAPFDVSDRALERHFDDPTEAPLNVSPERHLTDENKSYDPEAMTRLYHAALWDLDRKVTPLVRELVDDGTFVIVTSDHGLWDRDTAYAESRLHVPLVVFDPDSDPRTVPETVSLRQIPATILARVTGSEGGFTGRSLLEVASDRLATAEVLHHPNEVYERTGRVDVTKSIATDADVQRDLVLVQGDSRVEHVAGEWTVTRRGDVDPEALIKDGEHILSTTVHGTEGTKLEYDAATEQRLKDLGYM